MHVYSHATRIIGLGSPHGDDQAGWLAVDRLAQIDELDAQPIALRITTDLLDYLDGCQHLILIDACQSGDSSEVASQTDGAYSQNLTQVHQVSAVKKSSEVASQTDGASLQNLTQVHQVSAVKKSVGTLFRFEWPDPQLEAVASRSTHGLGIVEMLHLATALGKCPQRVVLFAVEIEACRPTTEPSELIRRALAQLVERVVAEIERPVSYPG
ncbi:MAG: hypothetical protein ACC645_03120 [Pirellulales bacterium]